MTHQSNNVTASVTKLSPEPEIKDPVDLTPSDSQPPGVDEEENEWEPQSLEEALTG